MNFVNLTFWQFFLGLTGAWLLINLFLKKGLKIQSNRHDRVFLLIVSIILFAGESVVSFLIFSLLTAIVITSCHFVSGFNKYKWSFVIFISLLCITPLLFFKYAPISVTQNFLNNALPIPIGISFYTFQLISLLVDSAKKGNSENYSVLDKLNYASFFPQIVAGPIERESNLLPQLKNFNLELLSHNIFKGIRFIILGLFYKLVLADNLAASSNWIRIEELHPLLVLVGNFTFGLQIYLDFCGYSLIAYGVARCLGVKITLNFTSPYTSRNIQQFWSNWHITLSNWFRDYIYISLGGNKSKKRYLLVLLVFLISGAWHGNTITFVIWGLMHGAGVVFVMLLAKKKIAFPPFFSFVITIFYVMNAWLFFYETNFTVARDKFITQLTPSAYTSLSLQDITSIIGSYGDLGYFVTCILLSASIIAVEFISKKLSSGAYSWSNNPVILILLGVVIYFTSLPVNNGFIYFNF